MDPDILALLIPIVAIVGGCTIAITKILSKNKGAALSNAQVQELTARLNKMEDEKEELEKRVENLQLILLDAPEKHTQLPPAEENLDQQMEELMRKKQQVKR